MYTVIIIGTNGVATPYEVSSRNWGAIVTEIGGLPANTRAQLIKIGNSVVGNLGLDEKSILPEGTNYLVGLTQAQMKGAFEVDFTADDVPNMSHRELVITCRDLRKSENDAVVEIIGDYTRDKSETLRNKLYEVIKYVWNSRDRVSVTDESFVTKSDFNVLAQRVLAIEQHLLLPSKEMIASLED